MEISLLQQSAIRIKGKNAVLSVDSNDKLESNSVILLAKSQAEIKTGSSEVIIDGPGEYETGGINITGLKIDQDLAYSISVDSLTVSLGKLSTLAKFQTKLKEANILIVNCDSEIDTAFLTSLAINVIVCYGEKASIVGKAIGGENMKMQPKYSSTIDKLPAELETVVLE
jgi:hypothetical protein